MWGHEPDLAWELWTMARDKEVLVENGEPGLSGAEVCVLQRSPQDGTFWRPEPV